MAPGQLDAPQHERLNGPLAALDREGTQGLGVGIAQAGQVSALIATPPT